jgi:ABC-type bacteriocin/lantibiotic exporter with double-glycine peptidase domain
MIAAERSGWNPGGARRKGRALLAAVFSLAAFGCATYPGTARPAAIDDLRQEGGWALLEDVPVVRQVSDQGCGAACASMVLWHWGVEATQEAIEAECADATTTGLRAVALRDAIRRRGLSAWLVAGSRADLEHEISRGRPVVVGLAKARGEGFSSHFAVVVGIHRDSGRVAAMDPGIGVTCDAAPGFDAEWSATSRVMLVVFRPEAESVTAAGSSTRKGSAR